VTRNEAHPAPQWDKTALNFLKIALTLKTFGTETAGWSAFFNWPPLFDPQTNTCKKESQCSRLFKQ
jgi:hypothetical protein